MADAPNTELATFADELVEAIREPLELDRWSIRLVSGPLEDARASCEASPEYREATISLDFDKLKTGDDLAEVVTHELGHCHTWPLHTLAEGLAHALADSAAPAQREGLRKLLLEQVRDAGERVTTDVGQTYLRLLRRAGVVE